MLILARRLVGTPKSSARQVNRANRSNRRASRERRRPAAENGSLADNLPAGSVANTAGGVIGGATMSGAIAGGTVEIIGGTIGVLTDHSLYPPSPTATCPRGICWTPADASPPGRGGRHGLPAGSGLPLRLILVLTGRTMSLSRSPPSSGCDYGSHKLGRPCLPGGRPFLFWRGSLPAILHKNHWCAAAATAPGNGPRRHAAALSLPANLWPPFVRAFLSGTAKPENRNSKIFRRAAIALSGASFRRGHDAARQRRQFIERDVLEKPLPTSRISFTAGIKSNQPQR